MFRFLTITIWIASLCVLAVGIVGWLSHIWLHKGDLAHRRDVEWPVGHTSVAIALPDGRYAVPLDYVGRIQIYSSNLQFQYGWRVPSGTRAMMTLVCRHDGRLEAFCRATGLHHSSNYVYDYIYDTDGALCSDRAYDVRTQGYPSLADHPENLVTLAIPQPWWSPFAKDATYFWLVIIAGALLGSATNPKRNWRKTQCEDIVLAPPLTPPDLDP